MKDLVIKLTGQITDSNFDQWKTDLIQQIQSANKQLSTDADFVNAELSVKQFKSAEKSLVEAKQSALEQAADIQKLFGAIDEISDETRKARLGLERQIKHRKEEIKESLIQNAVQQIDDFISELKNDYKLVNPLMYKTSEFIDAVKGKQTFKSMESALEELRLDIVDRISYELNRISECRLALDSISPNYKSLFQDEKGLLSMAPELLESTIKQRIAVHEADTLRRKAAAAKQVEEGVKKAAQQPENQPEVVQPIVKTQPVIEVSADPDQKSNSVLTILIISTKQDAINIAQSINDTHGKNPCVSEIKLAVNNNQEAA